MYVYIYVRMCTYKFVYVSDDPVDMLIDYSRCLVISRVVLMILITSSLNYWALQMLIRWVWLLWLYHVMHKSMWQDRNPYHKSLMWPLMFNLLIPYTCAYVCVCICSTMCVCVYPDQFCQILCIYTMYM